MRIAVNMRLVLPGRMDGIGWFAYETTRRMVALHPEHRFLLIFDRKVDIHGQSDAAEGLRQMLALDNVEHAVLCPQARHPVLWRMFFDISVPMALRRWKADALLSPDGMMPLHPHVPVLDVIHDLNFEHADDNLKPSHQRYMKRYTPLYAQRATRVATVSEYSKGDLAATYGLPAAKVDVVYDGAHDRYRPHTVAECEATRRRFTGGKPYIIFVSTILKRKNLATLLRAFDIVKDDDHSGLRLVVVGNRVWWKDELRDAYDTMRHRDDVVLMGRAEPTDLAALLSASEALVYPSLFEGFGIPILEAMYAETAVVCSNTTSMPEVGGDAAEYVDPTSDADVARGIRAVLQPGRRAALIECGRMQRTRYSWDHTAALLWQSLEKMMANE